MRTEPNAEMRSFAHHIHQMHEALLQEGFTEQRTLEIIGVTIAASFMQGGQTDGS